MLIPTNSYFMVTVAKQISASTGSQKNLLFNESKIQQHLKKVDTPVTMTIVKNTDCDIGSDSCDVDHIGNVERDIEPFAQSNDIETPRNKEWVGMNNLNDPAT